MAFKSHTFTQNYVQTIFGLKQPRCCENDDILYYWVMQGKFWPLDISGDRLAMGKNRCQLIVLKEIKLGACNKSH